MEQCVVVSHGHSEVKPVVGKVGGDVCLVIGATEVNGDSHIVWSRGPGDKVIINCDRGTWLIKASEKFQLDANGSLMIRSLTANDSGLYWGQIFSNLWSSQKFNLTVVGDHWDKLQPPHSPELEERKKMEDVEPDPKPPSAGPPQIRTHWIVIGLFGLAALLVCIGLVVRNWEKIPTCSMNIKHTEEETCT
ncbi:uncharacterized protein LOC115779548 isoform X4 [Archocentrus centrarchus]|uniref:uncharacterized protein LOC115779548 isoform X4 n=1 Tax=Archocentrus centrarchus TaxID=63155 RepID=UPI0011EA400C|nr:uncharacterized protein LOC115779548 isoform X4 [Archocentrus centrarchus]